MSARVLPQLQNSDSLTFCITEQLHTLVQYGILLHKCEEQTNYKRIVICLVREKKWIRFRLLCYSILRHLPSHSIWYVCWRETAEPENCHDARRASAEPLAIIRVGQQNYTGSRIKMAVAEKCSSSWLKHDVFMSPADVIDTTRRVCGRVYVTVRCPSFLVIDRCGSARRVCCCGPAGCRISIDCWATSSNGAAAARRAAAKASSVTFTAAVDGWTQTDLQSRWRFQLTYSDARSLGDGWVSSVG